MAAAAAAMAEQEGARNGARNRGGVQRVEGKLRASVEKGDYYEAHQMYRTLFFRWARAVAWRRGPASAAAHWPCCGAPHSHWLARLPVVGRSGGGGLGLLGRASSSLPGFPLLLLLLLSRPHLSGFLPSSLRGPLPVFPLPRHPAPANFCGLPFPGPLCSLLGLLLPSRPRFPPFLAHPLPRLASRSLEPPAGRQLLFSE